MLEKLTSIGTDEYLQGCQCKVVFFSEKFMQLCIRIYHPQTENSLRFLYFTGVYYFEGPMFWIGANFVQASDQIGVEIWQRVHPNESEQRLRQINMIFATCTVQTSSGLIKIAYGGLHISDEEPLSI